MNVSSFDGLGDVERDEVLSLEVGEAVYIDFSDVSDVRGVVPGEKKRIERGDENGDGD